jgi:hypothetical protein
MKASSKCLLFAALLVAMAVLSGCPRQMTVAEINRDPARYMNKEVAVTGVVSHSFGALGQGIYQVDDGTGSIWVLSDRFGVPSDGTRVGVAGTITPTVTFAGRSFATVLRETRRRNGG